MKRFLLISLIQLSSTLMFPEVLRFEDESLPSGWRAEAGTLQLDGNVTKEGEGALRWDFEAAGRIVINGLMGFRKRPKDATSNALSTFAYWIFNPKASDGQLRFHFLKEGRELGSFQMQLDFRGWRSAWIRYEWDIGEGIHEDPDQLVIEAPDHAGTLYWDLFATSVEIDSRSPVADRQVPFVGSALPKKPNDIWNRLLDFREYEQGLTLGNTGDNRGDAAIVEERWTKAFGDLYGISPENSPDFDSWMESFGHWNLERRSDTISGKPLFFASQRELLKPAGIPMDLDLRDFGKLFMKGAIGWTFSAGAERAQWEEGLLLMVDHLLEQGWADGSGQGVLHHLGYSMRELYRGLYLVRELLGAHGRLLPVRNMVSWYSGTGRMLSHEPVKPSLDTFNTQLEGMLISILMHPDPGIQDTLLRGLSQWLAESMRIQTGILPVFKEDGSVYHHRGHYPAYANGGFRGLGPVLHALGETSYALDDSAFTNLKEALLAYRFYSNKYHWPRSISGRHPNGTWTIHEEAFYWVARGAREGIDPDLAAAYLRLGRDETHLEYLRERGFKAEAFPAGTRTMPFAGITIHRRNGWMALVRGFSRYLWSHETYLGANLFGRYLSHGQLELLHRGNPVNPRDSGFSPQGWDWFHLPGTTNPVADYAYLEADVRNLDDESGFEEMLLSRERFNGGIGAESRGMHAVSLAGHDKYGDDLRSRKSYTFFDDWIVCLGSSIEADKLDYPVHTTLYQVALEAGNDWHSQPVHLQGLSLGIGESGVHYLEDPTGVGYYLPESAVIESVSGEQGSPNQKTGIPERGLFAKAWINHGTRPVNARYAYAIHMNGKTNGEELPFRILRLDRAAHVVAFSEGVIGHAFFEPDVRGTGGIESPVLAVNKPCLVQTKKMPDGGLELVIANPDLGLYEVDGNQWSSEGRQVEVSIYSRPWQSSSPKPLQFELLLDGLWELQAVHEGMFETYKGGKTILSLPVRGGDQLELKLIPCGD